VPTQQRRRSNDFQGIQHLGNQPIEANKQQPVHPLRGTTSQDVELMPEHDDFRFQRSARPEQPDQGTNLQRSLIERTIDRFAGVSQLL